MSTTSSEFLSIAKEPVIPESPLSSLCAGIPSSGKGPGVASKILPERQLSLSVKAFDPVADTPVLYKWMSLEYEGPLKGRPIPPQALQESYSCMIESDFAQPFMGLINGEPVCQVNIYKTRQDVISLYYDSRPDDYGLQLVLSPLAVGESMVILLHTCLEYFFSFREVGRIIADIEIPNELQQDLFKRVGFRLSGQIRSSYKMSDLLVCTRSAFRKTTPVIPG